MFCDSGAHSIFYHRYPIVSIVVLTGFERRCAEHTVKGGRPINVGHETLIKSIETPCLVSPLTTVYLLPALHLRPTSQPLFPA